LIFRIFIDNKTTDGDSVDSRQQGVTSFWASSDPKCKLDETAIWYLQVRICEADTVLCDKHTFFKAMQFYLGYNQILKNETLHPKVQ